MQHLTLITVLLVTLASVSSLAWASSSAEYSVNVTGQAVSVSINLAIFQNLTAYESTFNLPQIHSVLAGTNSTSVAEGVQTALQAKSPGAHVNNLRLEVDSTAWSSSNSLQWFNISLTMTVSGVSVYKSGNAQVDLSWKSFAVPSDISLGGVEVNNIGEKILLKVAGDLAAQSNTNPKISFIFFVNGREISPPQFPMIVGGLSTLNFSSLAAPISNWKETYDPLAQTSTWALSPARSWGMRFVLQSGQSSGVEKIDYELSTRTTGIIVAPTRLSVTGNTIVISVDSLPQTFMAAIILSISGVAVGATVYERRILKRPTRKRPKG